MRYKLVAFLLIVAAILAACGGTTNTPTAEPQGGDGGEVELSESFSGATAASGTLALNYPSGWTQSGTADGLGLANTDTGAVISVAVMPSAAASAMGSTPAAILTSYASAAASAGLTFSDPEDVTFGTNSGALVSATGNGSDTIIAIVSVNDAYVFLTLAAPEGAMAANRATLEAVASSLTLGS